MIIKALSDLTNREKHILVKRGIKNNRDEYAAYNKWCINEVIKNYLEDEAEEVALLQGAMNLYDDGLDESLTVHKIN